MVKFPTPGQSEAVKSPHGLPGGGGGGLAIDRCIISLKFDLTWRKLRQSFEGGQSPTLTGDVSRSPDRVRGISGAWVSCWLGNGVGECSSLQPRKSSQKFSSVSYRGEKLFVDCQESLKTLKNHKGLQVRGPRKCSWRGTKRNTERNGENETRLFEFALQFKTYFRTSDKDGKGMVEKHFALSRASSETDLRIWDWWSPWEGEAFLHHSFPVFVWWSLAYLSIWSCGCVWFALASNSLR